MSIKINAQTVIFKNSPVESVRQDKCEYCHAPFKTIMVTKTIKNTGVKSEIPIEVSGEYFNYCPKCRRRLN
ncbi:hypothetical protein B5G22_06770 [Limosilactobacillus reuteri]|jgi:hypothetical protein|uniref:Uncharacterized protein n=1 Tax=Limosilactobacillus reuteri TaxID=1598 RepID=A0A1Y3UG70_LIMRT|nr:hypothetical protein [Limosilactobacillus reuteri]PEG79074.1 hypothetical protein CP369_07385 [Lactobacillus sp. UMNPBX18]MCC4410499.1 hypothetical protein [Limosilactobacillus reuteri]MCC4414785.1 hypothetical protein [Limosilactobacillus reuteri]NME21885.1 hypothetical protein [Limosilactobacillus reuteri]OUN47115.1 hypothetical protein B5G22_06770 [Limosilactobacillus reuteri]